MARSKSSHRWLQEHFNDQYVQKAQQSGYRSRASFKLIEIDGQDKLFKSGMHVVDLGSAPGGWSQVAMDKTGKSGRVIASDILFMDPIPGVTFIKGDFTEESVYLKIIDALDNHPADLVISDMAPNISGIRTVDQARGMYLAELALDLSCKVLRAGGTFLVKVFQGEGFDTFLKSMRSAFHKVITRKPDASRARSRELYLLGRNYRGEEKE